MNGFQTGMGSCFVECAFVSGNAFGVIDVFGILLSLYLVILMFLVIVLFLKYIQVINSEINSSNTIDTDIEISNVSLFDSWPVLVLFWVFLS